VAVLAVTAFVFLAAGGHRAVGVFLAALVALMALVFCATAAALSPPVDQLAHGLVIPSIPPDSLTLIVALIGTTVVPYNLFLHASSVKFTWPREVPLDVALQECRRDCVVSIAIGGVITLTILVCAGAFYSRGMRIESAVQMAEQMAPLLGSWAKWFFAVGLLAAGFSSALTAPLAAAHAICGVLGWNTDFRSARFRAVWITVLVIGAGLALRQKLFLPAIVFAQAANGVLLPLIAGFLLVVVNRKALLGEYRNGWAANVAGGAVILVAAGLGFSQLAAAIQKTWR
jgi:manganese transport protein